MTARAPDDIEFISKSATEALRSSANFEAMRFQRQSTIGRQSRRTHAQALGSRLSANQLEQIFGNEAKLESSQLTSVGEREEGSQASLVDRDSLGRAGRDSMDNGSFNKAAKAASPDDSFSSGSPFSRTRIAEMNIIERQGSAIGMISSRSDRLSKDPIVEAPAVAEEEASPMTHPIREEAPLAAVGEAEQPQSPPPPPAGELKAAADAAVDTPARLAEAVRYHRSGEMGTEVEGDASLPLSHRCCGTFSCQGMEENVAKTNQDCACVASPLSADAQTAMFAVLDGHGVAGHRVSDQLLRKLYAAVGAQWWGAPDGSVRTQLIAAFEGAHASLAVEPLDVQTGLPEGRESGASGVAVLLRAGRLITAHTGDCRAVLGSVIESSGQLEAVELTRDHKLEDVAEAKRILQTGAWIKPMLEEPFFSPARVYRDQSRPVLGPGLTMSRALGDMDSDGIGIIPTPDVGFHTLRPGRDRCLVLASDGLWEFLSSSQVVTVVGGFMERGEPAIAAARFLIAMAAVAWRTEEGDYRDDITAIVVYLDDAVQELG